MKRYLLILFTSLSFALTFAQKSFQYTMENKPLTLVLKVIETNFNVTFSYSNEVVKDSYVTIVGDFTLDEIIDKLNAETPFTFEAVRANSYIIYKTKENAFPDDELSLIALDNVFISAYIAQGIDRESSGAINVKTDKLNTLPGMVEPDVMQTVQLLPGIISSNESATDLQIRGGSADQNLVLWDGIKMYHTGHYFGMFSAFNPYVTNSIDVYRSATQSRFGDRVSGIVDIQSKNDIPENIKGGFGFTMTHADALLELPIEQEKLAVIVSARRSYNDWISTFTADNYFDRVFQSTRISTNTNLVQGDEQFRELNNEVTYLDSNLKVLWKPSDKDDISVSALYVKNDLDYAIEDVEDENVSSDQLDLKNQGASLHWKRQWNNKWQHQFQTYISDYNSNYVFNENENSVLTESNRRFNQVKDFGIALETQYKLSDNDNISGGYQFYNTKIDYTLSQLDDIEEDFQDASSNSLNSHNLFVNYEKKWENFILNSGVRSTYLSSLERVYIEPRINSTYSFNKHFKLNASAEVKHQAISQFIEFDAPLPLENTIWTVADNEDNFVIRSKQFTLGFLLNKNNWRIDVEGYYKKLDNLSSYLRGFNNANAANNDVFSKGDGETIGIDILVKKKINDYNTWVSYTLSRTRQQFPEIQDGKFPSLSDKTHSFRWIHQYKWNSLELSLGWQYSSGNPFTRALSIAEDDDNDFFIEYESRNNSRLKSYHRLDASIMYHFDMSKNNNLRGQLGLSFINILNRKNELNKTYQIDEVDNAPDPVTINDLQIQEETNFGLKFTPNIVLRVWF
ncbi:TonB-dependent receptor [Winogradskyella sp. 3972H.M.0a.05]|uniref:TonB-dependent receptor domain-containing protein n=1 Tax=Winogradskyella sp. 3972H.M.0a.05 TaxID=2950277 RepID=UPI00339AD9FD